MTEKWIKANLTVRQDGDVTLIKYQDGGEQHISPATLATMTSTVSDPPSYAALSSLSIASQGWQAIFDDWKSKGIIS